MLTESERQDMLDYYDIIGNFVPTLHNTNVDVNLDDCPRNDIVWWPIKQLLRLRIKNNTSNGWTLE